jgi:Na+/H+ antiporter NhaD/arsenite permease-like protein
MFRRLALGGFLGILFLPSVAGAAEDAPLDLPFWSVAPFVLLLLSLAVLSVVAETWWHRNRNKAIVAALFAVPTAAYLLGVQLATGQAALPALAHEMGQYVSFILLLGSLYVVAGGIVPRGDLAPRPLANVAFLAVGAVLANLIGTTGAGVLLIRPFLRINRLRANTAHLPLFFIFTIGNLGGLLTPLGDPPLFLGFLKGVPFWWTLSLWPQWLVANGLVLVIFLVWDTLASRKEPAAPGPPAGPDRQPFRLEGWINLLLLAGILAPVLLQPWLPPFGGAAIMAAMGLLSWWLTPRRLRQANGFTWGPLVEVAILFAGIFVTMVPALALLSLHGKDLGVSQPWEYFWLTGLLSSCLDNAPTYLTFATMAAGSTDFLPLVEGRVAGLDGPRVLAAISCGAVFMGALTYIGNGPNFMVKAIAHEAGFQTPSFFGYLAWSSVILLPVFVLITFVFFSPP